MHNARHDYLATEVMTATPQKLQLMLVEGALRFGNVAREQWRTGDLAAASESLIRCQQIVAEMISGLNREETTGLVQKISAVYMFAHRALVEANLTRSEAKLNEALRVLEIDRETWRLATQKAGKTVNPPHISLDGVESLGQSFVA